MRESLEIERVTGDDSRMLENQFPFITNQFWKNVLDTAGKISHYNFRKALIHQYSDLDPVQASAIAETVQTCIKSF
jgi:hypothetical protein